MVRIHPELSARQPGLERDRGALVARYDVAVGLERQRGVVAELAGDVDHGAGFVQRQSRERVPQVVGHLVRDAGLEGRLPDLRVPRVVAVV